MLAAKKKLSVALLSVAALASPHSVQAASPVGFEAHQTYISALAEKHSFDIKKPAEVLEFVLSQSSKVIHVQPTENYSYFKFTHNGLHWQGNMRLEVEFGAPDKLHFAYFVVPAPWHTEDLGKYKAFGAKDGLSIEKTAALDFKIGFRNISRQLKLNDIRKSEVPKNIMGPAQEYLGLANDESGLRFYLLFDKNVADFAYILDEQTTVAEKFVPLEGSKADLLVGVRTGFVFKDEPTLSRKRLVGVYSENISSNNYYDGPFDQLPDGYSGKLTVKTAFEFVDKEFSKTIDDFGNFIGREGSRVVIAPYIRWGSPSDFDSLASCEAFGATSVDYRSCMKLALER